MAAEGSSMRKAIIVGGGPAGLITALRLQQITNVVPVVYELRPHISTLGGSIGILPNGLRLLHTLGVYDELTTRGSGCSILTLRSLNGHVITAQDVAMDTPKKNGGFGYLRIKRLDVVEVLADAAKKANIPVHYGKQLTKIEEDDSGVTITFSDGTTDTADMLFGCDGIHSAIRRLYVNPEAGLEYTGISSYGAIVKTDGLPKEAADKLQGINSSFTAEGVFSVISCSPTGSEVHWGYSKEMMVPDATGTTLRDAWEVKAKEEVAAFKQPLLTLLNKKHGEWGTTLKQLVNDATSVNFYPIYRLSKGGNWSRGRCLLIGDAAHAMAPFAGQGISMATEDAFLISRLLSDPSRTLEDAHAAFDRIRRPRIEEIMAQAAYNAQAQKKTSELGLIVKEVAIWAYFWAANVFGFSTAKDVPRQLIYNIEDEKI